MSAVAYCRTTHSQRFGAQMPTRSPLRDAGLDQPGGQRLDRGAELGVGAAGGRSRGPPAPRGRRSAATVRRRLSPIVSPSSGTVDVPLAYDPGTAGPYVPAVRVGGEVRLLRGGRVHVRHLLRREGELHVLAERRQRTRPLGRELADRQPPGRLAGLARPRLELLAVARLPWLGHRRPP